MATINPYLNFNGNCEEAFEFYKNIFGGEYRQISRFKDMPSEHPYAETEGNRILHVALPLGRSSILMGSDIPEAFPKAVFGSNCYISLNTDSEEEANKLFSGLAAGGNVHMPMGKTFWGAYFGMLADKFGIQWMVNYDYQ